MEDKTFQLKVYSTNKQEAENILQARPAEVCFNIHEGESICSLEDLVQSIEVMQEATYLYHANKEKNDFANWSRDVLGDERLADDLHKCTNKTEAAACLSKRLIELRRISNGKFI